MARLMPQWLAIGRFRNQWLELFQCYFMPLHWQNCSSVCFYWGGWYWWCSKFWEIWGFDFIMIPKSITIRYYSYTRIPKDRYRYRSFVNAKSLTIQMARYLSTQSKSTLMNQGCICPERIISELIKLWVRNLTVLI